MKVRSTDCDSRAVVDQDVQTAHLLDGGFDGRLNLVNLEQVRHDAVPLRMCTSQDGRCLLGNQHPPARPAADSVSVRCGSQGL